ncbi:MAG: amidohydrolase family protein [Halobacteria archaeon]|nr:amidohydrolase family protein [Halobacteria archaeon]
MKAFECGKLIDGLSDKPLENAVVLVEDGEIEEVGSQGEVSIPDDADVVDHSENVVIPGLIDAHLHLVGTRSMNPFDWIKEDVTLGTARATADLRKLLRAGFTSVRDVGSGTALGLRDAVQEGEIPGPRIYTSGRSISQTAGHGDAHYLPYTWVTDESKKGLAAIADGPDECRKEVRKRIREGVDLIKIMTTGGVLSEKDSPEQSQFTDEEIEVFTEEAHRVGIPVASHAQGGPGIKSALRNGVDTIEHGFYLDDEAIDLMKETDAVFVPTLSIMHRLVTRGDEYGVPEYGLEKANHARDAHFKAVKLAYENDVSIALGTDFIGPELVPHGENVLEAELLVEMVGLSEMDAIKAGTSVAARTVWDEKIGAIEEGRYADIVALDSDPLEDITALRETKAVYKEGKKVEV